MSNFVGRKEEINLLNGLLEKQSASLVVVYGRRRIGKSRLIEEFGQKYHFVSFSGLFPSNGTTSQDQLNEFGRLFKTQFNIDIGELTDWGDAFQQLAERTKKGRIVILFDEISWMGYGDINFLGKLKNAWDMAFKKNDQLILVLCGSVSVWIEENILSNRGFYGRISLKLRLKELELHDCSHFWDGQAGYTDNFEKLKVLSVTGGIPKYLEEVKAAQSAEANINRLCFSPHGLLFNDYDYIFTSMLERHSEYYQDIIKILGSGSLERNQIIDKLKIGQRHGALTDYLEELNISGFLQRDYTWHLKSEKMARLSKYRLSDNYLRFYVKYILPNLSKIQRDGFKNKSLGSLPGWNTMMGLQIENLVLNNRERIKCLLGIHPDEVVNDGPFFQRKTNRQLGCQIDYLIQTKFGVLYLCEVKFSLKGVRSSVISEVQEKIKRLSTPRNFSVKPVLLHVGELYEGVMNDGYFARIIDLTKLLLESE